MNRIFNQQIKMYTKSGVLIFSDNPLQPDIADKLDREYTMAFSMSHLYQLETPIY